MTTTLTLFAMLIASLTGPPASLAEAARREAIRRQLSPPAAVSLSNDTLPGPWLSDLPVTPDPSAPAPSATSPSMAAIGLPAPPAAASAGVTAATPTEAAHDETFWRGRFSALQKAIADGQSSVEKLQSEINGLTASVAGRDDPAEREVLRQQLSNAMRELDRVQSKLETDRRAVETMRRDARHEGAPPGWLR